MDPRTRQEYEESVVIDLSLKCLVPFDGSYSEHKDPRSRKRVGVCQITVDGGLTQLCLGDVSEEAPPESVKALINSLPSGGALRSNVSRLDPRWSCNTKRFLATSGPVAGERQVVFRL